MKMEGLSNYNQFMDAIETLSQCTDDYFFFADLNTETYTISDAAAKRFNMPSNSYNNALKVFATFVHPDDYFMLVQDLLEVKKGNKDGHNLQYRWLDSMGNTVWINCRGKLVKGRDGVTELLVGRISEIGKQSRADNVTGFLGEAELRDNFVPSKYSSGYIMRLFIKNVYDIVVKHGEESSDELMKLLSNSIRDCMSKNESCYYYSRGMFTIFSTEGNEEDAFNLFKKISDHAAHVNEMMGYKYIFKLRAGVVPHTAYDPVAIETIKKCEFSSTFVTTLSSQNFYIYSESDHIEYNYSRELLNALQVAVQENFKGFELNYQPVLSADNKELFGVEALLRYRDEKFGSVSPCEFIPLLEESGLIIPVGKWVVINAIEKCNQWQKIYPDLHVSVNLSYIQLEREEVLAELLDIISKNDINNKNLILEFTESGSLMNDVLTSYIKMFRKGNINLALDDFGTGYSNLLYLNKLQIDVLKIDRTFVAACDKDEYCFKLIKHIIEMAHSMGIQVCLEGIETKAELDRMSGLAPDYYQGFYFSRPLSVEKFEEMFL